MKPTRKSQAPGWRFNTGQRPRRQPLLIVLMLALQLSAVRAVMGQQLGPVAYQVPTSPEASWIRIISANGSSDHPVPQINGANAVASMQDPVWSKDGQQLAASALFVGTSSLAIVAFNPNSGVGTAVLPSMNSFLDATSPWAIYKTFSPAGLVSSTGAVEPTRIAFETIAGNYSEYGIISLDGTSTTVSLGSRNLLEEPMGQGLDWHPKKDRLVVSSSYDYWDMNCFGGYPRSEVRLFLARPVSGGLDSAQPLTNPPQPLCPNLDLGEMDDILPAFSPDGTKVAFVRKYSDDNSGLAKWSWIMIINADGTNERMVWGYPGIYIPKLSWSGDGSKLIFEVDGLAYFGTTPYSVGIWTIAASGSASPVRFLAAPAAAPSWSPVLQ
jgi:hypothetical protein